MSLRDRLGTGDQGAGETRNDLLGVIGGVLHQQIVQILTEQQEQGAAGSPGAPVGPILSPGAPADPHAQVIALATDLLARNHQELTPGERSRVVDALCDDIFAFGPITSLLRDPTVSEVMVNGPGAVYAERQGQMVRTDLTFRDTRHVMAVVEKILAPLGRRVDESSPMVDARLPDGSRVNVIIPPVCLGGPAITIRKFKEDGLAMEDLIAMGSLTREMADFLTCCVAARLNILVSGGTGSGKTTLLNVLSGFIPSDERIITIEDAAELRLRQGHVLSLESRPANPEGKGEITIRDLLRNALRMRPNRIVIGECRGGEALDLLQAMNTGHDGCLSTLHANRPRDAIARLETLSLMAKLELPVRMIREQIAAAVDLLVHVERYEDGSRRVGFITEVHGMEGDVVTLQEVFAFQRDGIGEGGRIQGRFIRSAVAPAALAEFRKFGLPGICWGQGV